MEQPVVPNSSAKRLIASKPIFVSAILLFIIIIFSVWLSGMGIHRSIFKNAIFATSIISFICFLFFSISLFNGFKLKDNVGKLTPKFKWGKFSDLPSLGSGGSSGGGGHFHFDLEGIFEIIIAVVLGIVAILFLLVLLWLFGNLLWAFVLFIAAALYWIFFRAIRFVLRHSGNCKGNFWRSIRYGFGYTVLYSFTFYLLILIPYFMNRH